MTHDGKGNEARPVLIANNLSLQLPSADGMVDIVRSISFSIHKHKKDDRERGIKVAITGPSGSGKTSLLMLLAGLERPTSGTLHVEGKAIQALNNEELTRFRNQHIGIVFQEFHLMPTMTARENVALPLELREGGQDVWKKADATLESVGLAHRVQHYPSQLSGGEQQRVAIARACVTQPDIILADEPTGNLDQATGEQVINMLFSQQDERGSTLLLITHDEALAARCDMQIVMRDGTITEIHEHTAGGQS